MEAEWTYKPVDESLVGALSEALEISPFLARLLVKRDVVETRDGRQLLEAPLSSLPKPEGMKDLEAGIDIVLRHLDAGKKIAVFGDYDVDGICSTAMLSHFLTALGGKVETFLANRFDYGYGLGADQAEKIARGGASCALLVDCGTSDLEAAAFLESRDIRTVVIDHHRVGDTPPPVSAFINPMQGGCGFSCKALTSAGLCFYFVAMMSTRVKERSGAPPPVDPRDYLDLAAVGTLADVAPVRGANRSLIRAGLKRLHEARRPAMARMMAAAGAVRCVADEHVVTFSIAPLLNAAGRMGDPTLALRFLLAADDREARALHARISLLNEKRREEDRRVLKEARFQMSKMDLGNRRSLVLHKKGWHQGVLGIVASRLAGKLQIPVAIIGVEGKTGRGSIRAPGETNLFSPLSEHREIFERFGGHSAAMGFSIEAGRIGELEEALERVCGALPPHRRQLELDAKLGVDDVRWAHLLDIERLAPFGRQNPAPLICLENVNIRDCRIVGDDHLKIFATGRSREIGAFGPNMGGRLREVTDGVSLAGHLRADTYRGGEALELLVLDIKPPPTH
ncbi:MAG: single-stranded-DNA-specific exonuclease RecJ [Pseudomonadota bacterium]